MATVTMDIPEEIMDFMVCENKSDELRRNALLLYPFIKNETISHGRAADILGISKWELIELYGSEGIPYIDQSWDEVEQDAANITECVKTLQETDEEIKRKMERGYAYAKRSPISG
ncbi:UPF0175 family protein [uncultured Fibrobacter sp.]|uniref:UPF0175 family protein n=1 Tax=uncultured Fibrobacter sp. TaxID=261512 RepID=UPI0025CF955E|nr:UPF0175 family protein [uncultured Fibrobacter sp.]